jgi:hypothetical protein
MATDPCFVSAVELANQVRRGDRSPVDVVETTFTRIEDQVLGERAELAARRSESSPGVAVADVLGRVPLDLEHDVRVDPFGAAHQADCDIRAGDVARDVLIAAVLRVVVDVEEFCAASIRHASSSVWFQ